MAKQKKSNFNQTKNLIVTIKKYITKPITEIVTNLKKSNVFQFKTLKCNKTQKLKLEQNYKIQMVNEKF